MAKQKKGAVLITGASSGIGKAIALLLDGSGYKVFAGVRKSSDGEQLKGESSKQLSPVILDITDSEQIAQAVKTVTNSLGGDQGLAGLINNAGIGVGGPLEFLPLDDLRRQLEVNVIGHIGVTQAFLPLIRKERGRIINIGSMAGRVALPFSGPYASSKFAIRALSDALRRELAWWKIPVVLLEPGSVDTPIWTKSFKATEERTTKLPARAYELYEKPLLAMDKYMKNLLKHATSSEAVASVVRRALEARRPKTRYAVGLDAHLGFMTTFMPDRLIDWLLHKEQERNYPK